jgi:hypothetical protein
MIASNEISDTTAQIDNIRILAVPPRMLRKSHSSHDNLV